MALDRGTLAKIDRRILAEFDHSLGVRLVKVPVSDAVWATWRRYCEAVGLSMGVGIAGLITHELQAVAEAGGGDAVFLTGLVDRAAAREVSLDAGERDLDVREQRLRTREQQLRTLERRIRAETSQVGRSESGLKVGRNERCPCGSGLKYKYCHDLARRRT